MNQEMKDRLHSAIADIRNNSLPKFVFKMLLIIIILLANLMYSCQLVF